MDIALMGQIDFLTQSCVLGIIFGILFDCFKIFRCTHNLNSFFIAVVDICYFIIIGFVSFVVSAHLNAGRFRLFILVGIFCGGIFYIFFMSSFILKLLKNVFKQIKNIMKILFFPVKIILFCLRKLFFLLNKIYINLKFLLKINKDLVYNIENEISMMQKEKEYQKNESKKK